MVSTTANMNVTTSGEETKDLEKRTFASDVSLSTVTLVSSEKERDLV